MLIFGKNRGFQGQDKGFGIGTILMAVILIAAVVAAIAAATRSGGLSGIGGEKDRINASSVINAGSEIGVALSRAVAVGYNIVADVELAEESEDGKFALFNRSGGNISRPKIPNSAMQSNAAPLYIMTAQDVAGAISESDAEGRIKNLEALMTISPLKQDVCRHINNILHQSALTGDLIVESSAAADDFLYHWDATPLQLGDYDEGCIAFGEEGLNQSYVYFRLVQNDMPGVFPPN